MKVWTKVRLKDYNKKVYYISRSLTNYLYKYGPILDIERKYNISDEDMHKLNQYSANRIAGILMLYLARDFNRINDIVNKYDIPDGDVREIIPEIEGYINKKKTNK